MKAIALALALAACGPSTPTPVQQGQVTTYAVALQACIADAKASDGGLARYETCARGVDATFKVTDGGH